MMRAAIRELDPVRIPDDQRLPDDIIEIDDEGREGVVLSPEDEEELEKACAEAEEDRRAGRFRTREGVGL